MEVLIYLDGQGLDENSINTTAEQTLESISEEENEYGYSQALEILKINGGDDYELPFYYPPEGQGERKSKKEEEKPSEALQDEAFFKLYPNPFNKCTYLDYQRLENSNLYSGRIIGEDGVLINRFEFGSSSGKLELCNFDRPGVYIIIIENYQGELFKQKIVHY